MVYYMAGRSNKIVLQVSAKIYLKHFYENKQVEHYTLREEEECQEEDS